MFKKNYNCNIIYYPLNPTNAVRFYTDATHNIFHVGISGFGLPNP